MNQLITGVDRLIQLVESKGNISAKDASVTLEVGCDTIKEWARLLERRERVKVKYGLRNTVISVVEEESETANKSKPSQYLSQLKTTEVKAEQRFLEIDQIRKKFAAFQELLAPEILQMKRDLDQLNLYYNMEKAIKTFTKEQLKAAKKDLRDYQRLITLQSRRIERQLRVADNTKQMRKKITQSIKLIREEKKLARQALVQRDRTLRIFLKEQQRVISPKPRSIEKRASKTIYKQFTLFRSKQATLSKVFERLSQQQELYRKDISLLRKELQKGNVDKTTVSRLNELIEQQKLFAQSKQLLAEDLRKTTL